VLSNGNVVSPPGTTFDPIYKTHTLVPYSNEAQRRHEVGVSIFSVSIGEDGAPTEVTISRSSASQRLNDAAMEYIKRQWRWPSPMKSCGQATAQTPVSVYWNLVYSATVPDAEFHLKMPISAYPPGAFDKLEMGSSTLLEIETDAQGAITGGLVIHTSGFPDLDDQALAVVKNSPALMKSQATGKHILSADWDIPPGTFPPHGETVIRTGREMPK
jgi:TonB family protein